MNRYTFKTFWFDREQTVIEDAENEAEAREQCEILIHANDPKAEILELLSVKNLY